MRCELDEEAEPVTNVTSGGSTLKERGKKVKQGLNGYVDGNKDVGACDARGACDNL